VIRPEDAAFICSMCRQKHRKLLEYQLIFMGIKNNWRPKYVCNLVGVDGLKYCLTCIYSGSEISSDVRSLSYNYSSMGAGER
jgi:hypothetical protein